MFTLSKTHWTPASRILKNDYVPLLCASVSSELADRLAVLFDAGDGRAQRVEDALSRLAPVQVVTGAHAPWHLIAITGPGFVPTLFAQKHGGLGELRYVRMRGSDVPYLQPRRLGLWQLTPGFKPSEITIVEDKESEPETMRQAVQRALYAHLDENRDRLLGSGLRWTPKW